MPILGPPEALSPKDWHAIVDYDEWGDLYTPDTGVVFHHGGSADYPAGRTLSVADEVQQLQQWEGYHLYSKGWRGLAYGWGVGQTGTIYRIRGWNSYGAHRGDHDGDGISNNEELIPIIWIASGNHHTVSQAAQDAVSRLRRWMLASAPQATWLYGHREVSTTTCPGPNGMAYVTVNRELEDDMAFSKGLSADQWRNLYGLGIAGGASADAVAAYWTDPARTDEQHERASAELFETLAERQMSGAHDHDGRYLKGVEGKK